MSMYLSNQTERCDAAHPAKALAAVLDLESEVQQIDIALCELNQVHTPADSTVA